MDNWQWQHGQTGEHNAINGSIEFKVELCNVWCTGSPNSGATDGSVQTLWYQMKSGLGYTVDASFTSTLVLIMGSQ
jgi:hypothetical protein